MLSISHALCGSDLQKLTRFHAVIDSISCGNRLDFHAIIDSIFTVESDWLLKNGASNWPTRFHVCRIILKQTAHHTTAHYPSRFPLTHCGQTVYMWLGETYPHVVNILLACIRTEVDIHYRVVRYLIDVGKHKTLFDTQEEYCTGKSTSMKLLIVNSFDYNQNFEVMSQCRGRRSHRALRRTRTFLNTCLTTYITLTL